MTHEGQEARGAAFQVAALPWRRRKELEILLITSRETQRWLIPRGWPMAHLPNHGAAAQEALEEGGVEGIINPVPFAEYFYHKERRGLLPLLCKAQVFSLEVKHLRSRWPEKHERERRWFPAQAAIMVINQPGLADVVAAFAAAQG